MSQDLPSGVAYDSWHDFNPFFATLALPRTGVRSSEQASLETLSRAWCGRQGEGKAIWRRDWLNNA